MKIKITAVWVAIILFGAFYGKNIFAQTNLNKYIEEGILNNIVLNQKEISLEKAMYSLKIAASLFFPSIDLEGNYTSGEGGRNISFPVGDLLNPVYSTLNQLTKSSSFPQLDNVKINFFPFHYYDIKLRTTMPIINTDLIYNHSIQSDQVHIKEYEVDAYKKELTKEIKTAYYNYLSAVSGEKIYQNALKVAEEGKRVNESLLENGKGLPVYILRSESEIADIESKIVETQNSSQTAKRYFNFILNKDLNSNIDTSYNIQLKISKVDSLLVGSYDISDREELRMLETGVNINESVLKMKKLYWVPKVNAFLDMGAQDQIWNLNKDSRYYLFGFQLSVPIFEAFRNSYKADEAELNVKDSQLNYDFTAKQIQLSQSIARNDLISARKNYYTAEKKYRAVSSYERLIEKGYREGVNTFIETIDARSQLTQAAVMVNININKVLSALANYEREIGSRINSLIGK